MLLSYQNFATTNSPEVTGFVHISFHVFASVSVGQTPSRGIASSSNSISFWTTFSLCVLPDDTRFLSECSHLYLCPCCFFYLEFFLPYLYRLYQTNSLYILALRLHVLFLRKLYLTRWKDCWLLRNDFVLYQIVSLIILATCLFCSLCHSLSWCPVHSMYW